jgi:hypothetical protein
MLWAQITLLVFSIFHVFCLSILGAMKAKSSPELVGSLIGWGIGAALVYFAGGFSHIFG